MKDCAHNIQQDTDSGLITLRNLTSDGCQH